MSTAPQTITLAPREETVLPTDLELRDLFKIAFRHHAAGVAVITAEGKDGPVALTATSVISVSAEPPVFAFSLSADSGSASHIKTSKSLVVHLLRSGQLDIARLCSTRGVDRFADTSKWYRLPSGDPVFAEAPVWIRGTIIGQMDLHGSTIVAVRASEINTITEATSPDDAKPLIYHDRAWHALSEASKIQT